MTSTQKTKWQKVKKGCIKRGRILFWASCLFTWTGFGGRFWMPLELTSHFRMQYFLILAIAALIFIYKKRGRHLAVTLLCLVGNGCVIIPWYIADSSNPAGSGGTQIRILLSNVHTSNDEYQRLIELINKENPDVIVLQEIDNKWVSKLGELKKTYSFQKVIARADNFGIGVFSKIHLENIMGRKFGQSQAPTIVATINYGCNHCVLVATHTLPPASPGYFSQRNQQLADIAEFVNDSNHSSIVIGDLNLTMWSYYYGKFLDDSGLKDARKGFGINPTWPTMIPPLYIPLEHCLCSSDIEVLDFRTGQRIGSDHLPLVVDLVLP